MSLNKEKVVSAKDADMRKEIELLFKMAEAVLPEVQVADKGGGMNPLPS